MDCCGIKKIILRRRAQCYDADLTGGEAQSIYKPRGSLYQTANLLQECFYHDHRQSENNRDQSREKKSTGEVVSQQ